MYIKYTMGDFSYDTSSLYIKYTMVNFEAAQVTDGNFKSVVTVAESYFNVFTRNTPNNSTVTLQDSAVPSRIIKRYLEETEELSDGISKSLTLNRLKNSTVTLVDNSNYLIILPKHAYDSVSIIENTSIAIYHTRGMSNDLVELMEVVGSSLKISKQPSDLVNITEKSSYFFAGFINKYYVEEVSLSDVGTYSIFAPTFKVSNNTVGIADNSYHLINRHGFSDTVLNLGETVPYFVNTTPIAKSLSAVVDIIDSTEIYIKQYKTASVDAIYLTNTPVYRNFSDVKLTSMTTVSILKSSSLYLPPIYSTLPFENYLGHTLFNRALFNKMLSGYRLNLHQQQTIPTDSVLYYGFIKSPVTKDFKILSGGPVDLTVTSIQIPGYFGITLEGLEVGAILPAGDSITFDVIAHDNTGRLEVDNFFVIHFDYGQYIKVWVRITRARVYDLFITPDRDSYSEGITFQTKIFESINNVRKTEPLMEQYKHSCKYTATATHTKKHRAFLNIFRQALWVPVVHPLWGHTSIVTDFTYNSAVINCVTYGCDFRVGQQVFVFQDVDEYYKAFVLVVNEGHLVIDRKLTVDKGHKVTPSFKAIAKGSISTSYSVESYAKLNIEVEEFYPYD